MAPKPKKAHAFKSAQRQAAKRAAKYQRQVEQGINPNAPSAAKTKRPIGVQALDAPATYDPDWFKALAPGELRDRLERDVARLREWYTGADPLVLDRLLWVARVLERIERRLAKCFAMDDMDRSAKAEQQWITLYKEFAAMAVEALALAEQQRKRNNRLSRTELPLVIQRIKPPVTLPMV